jgi:flagellar hook-associated protein 1 FlgK
MSLGLALNNAVSGLKLNQQALAVLSNNLANVNTEGYTRKELNQQALYIEGVGSGVRIEDITRKVDIYLQRSAQNQGSEVKRLQTIDDYYQRMQVLLGEPGSTNSLDEYMTTFFNSLQQMADQPERTSYRSNFVNAANTLATAVSGLAQEIESLRFQADIDIGGSVTAVNASLKKLHELNGAIARAKGLGQATAGLLDERDTAINNLMQQMNVTVGYNQDGTISVTAGNGVPLVDGNLHQLQYVGAGSVDNFINNDHLNAIQVLTFDINGRQTGNIHSLVTAGKDGERISGLTGGTIQGLIQVRDGLMPDILNQLDMLASRIRDAVNAVHNDGSGMPPATQLTGQRLTTPSTVTEWTGAVRIAVLNKDGTPVNAGYADEAYTGKRPLTLDLGSLNYGQGAGRLTTQNILDEINQHFGAPQVKTELGNLNNIQLTATSNYLPSGLPNLFNFDFNAENISADSAKMFVTGVTVRDSGGLDITNVTQDVPSIALATTNTYETFTGTGTVDITLASAAGLKAGDTIYLGTPGAANVNGINAANLTGYFTIESVSGNKIRITAANGAVSGSSSIVSDASGVTANAAYSTIGSGLTQRTGKDCQLQVDLSANIASAYYDITVNVGVVDDEGNVSTSQITYRVQNNQSGIINDRYASTTATGDAHRELPATSQATLRAILVDEKGNELPMVNGQYVDAKGYIKIVGGSEDYVIALDELDSADQGDNQGPPVVAGTGNGFSHYFGMNNFFDAPENGELKGSALNLRVQDRILKNPNLVAAGDLVLQKQPTDPNAPPQYTYVRYAGDNSVAQRIAALSSKSVSFDAVSGMPATQVSLQSYTSEMLGYMASITADATDTLDNAQILYDGFNNRAEAVSGVNLDEELANTVVFQNAYSATARIVTVVDEMFQSLIDAT